MNPWINALVAIVVAFVGGGLGSAAWKALTDRRGVKAEAGRTEAEAEVKRQEARRSEADRLALLAEVERKGYAASKRAADERYGALKDDYVECRRVQTETQKELREVRAAVEPMIRAFDALMARVVPNGHEVAVTMTRAEADAVLAAITAARSHMA